MNTVLIYLLSFTLIGTTIYWSRRCRYYRRQIASLQKRIDWLHL